MNFQFDSLAAFLHMDGHGFYVWLAYGIALAVLLLILLAPWWQLRSLRRSARRARALEEALLREGQREAEPGSTRT